MNGIQPVGTSLKQLDLAIDTDDEAVESTPCMTENCQQADDIIAIGAQALQRYQRDFPENEAIDSNTAMQLLEQVKSTSLEDLEQAHQAFDPERVFRLVGLLD